MLESNFLPRGLGPFSTQTSSPKIIITTKPLLPKTTLSPSLYMINPFISNNDQYLFRKNYQVLARPEPTSLHTPLPNDNNLRYLQYRNPFISNSPNISLRNSSVTSPQRPNSLSRATTNNTNNRFAMKGGILDSADGWKKQLENRQRQKLQVYGAEGLRYNAYQIDEKLLQTNNEYYKLQEKPKETKPLNYQNYPASDTLNIYYQSPRDNLPQQKPKAREMFEDEIFQSPNFHINPPSKVESKPESKQRSNSSRHSKVNDMFQSQFDDRFKKSMQYGSMYGGGYQQQMLESKRGNIYGSKFRDSGSKNRQSVPMHRTISMQSEVSKVEVIAPMSINLQGRIYYRINI